MNDLSASLGVATCCGRCTDCARSVLAESLATVCPYAVAGAGDD
jgi:bacterioferritin-associated ferredoxin